LFFRYLGALLHSRSSPSRTEKVKLRFTVGTKSRPEQKKYRQADYGCVLIIFLAGPACGNSARSFGKSFPRVFDLQLCSHGKISPRIHGVRVQTQALQWSANKRALANKSRMLGYPDFPL